MFLTSCCPSRCPACAHRHLTLDKSLAQKNEWLSRSLAPWAEHLRPIRSLPEKSHRGYRDRVTLTTVWIDGHWQFGVTRRDEFVPIPDCPIHSDRVRATIGLLSHTLPSPDGFQLAYLAQSGAQTVLVLKQAERPDVGWFTATLASKLEAIGVDGFWLHCFPAVGRHLFAKNGWYRLWGSERSRDEKGNWYGPGAFTQLLPDLHGESLDEAASYLAPGPGDRVVDLYCGRGLSLQRWLQAGAGAMGVELGGEALFCARLNAPAAQLLRGGCAQRIPQLEAWWSETPSGHRLAYLNPPRTGLEARVTNWLAKRARPARIAYLSCSAGTLARDLTQFCADGYQVERITPYDFFPRTYHVETLTLLRRLEGT